MEAAFPKDVSLALYLRLLQASGGTASHHGSHMQDPAYYDRFGEIILSSLGSPSVSIVPLSQRPELLEQGIAHTNPEVIVVTLRIAALTMAADLAPLPDSNPSFFTRFSALLHASPPLPNITPRIREAAMHALSQGCSGSRTAVWTLTQLNPLIHALIQTMADGALHRIAASASSLLATLVLRFGSAALSIAEPELAPAFTAAPNSQLSLSILDWITTLLCELRAPISLISTVLTPQRQRIVLGWLQHRDAVVRGRTASALLLLSRCGALDALGGEETVLNFAQTLCSTADGLLFAAELLGGLALSTPALQQRAFEHLSTHFASLSAGSISSRQECVALSAVLTAIDARTSTVVLLPAFSTSLVSLLRAMRLDASSMTAPQRLFKVLLRILESRAKQHTDETFIPEALTVLLAHLRHLHEQRLHQLTIDVLRCLTALVPASAPAASTAATVLAELAEFAAARLAESDGAWEVRDSIAEMLGSFVSVPALRTWCLRAPFMRGLRQLVSQPDLETFVYATVANTLCGYAATEEGWLFMAREEQAFLACCSASLSAQESLLRRSAVDMLSKALSHSHSASAVRAFMTTPQCRAQFTQLSTDDDFEVRATLVRLLTVDVWPHATFFELSGDQILLTLLQDSHRVVRGEACQAALKMIQNRDAASLSAAHKQCIDRLAQLPLEEMRQGSGPEALYGKDVEEFLHPQSQANVMDCD